ncbi:MAG TPA: hypothetical protein VL500_05860 [Candidatus Eisenbacteria bacterium]|jgi:hypothetical protein|nr:hypothetical protein [Candidatus Eisenbacteria bacterium]
MDAESSEYGRMKFIYVAEEAQRQLNGEGDRKWYAPIASSEEPSAGRPIKVRVPEDAVSNGIFYPDRYEPDLAAESCERVKIVPPEGMKPLRKGDRVKQTLHGPGAIVTDGYDAGTIVKVSGGKAYVHWDGSEDEYSSNVYDPATGHEVDPPIPGFNSKVHRLEAKVIPIKPGKKAASARSGKKSMRKR